MARPQRLEKLRHGRLLCGSVFRFFVETWNWLTAYVDNMKGDAETDPQSGYITIDRADPDHPVIRFRADKVAGGGGTVTPDDISTEFIPNNPAQGADNTHEGELQIKGWNKGTPASGTTIAQDINNPPSNPSALVERDYNGVLKYKGLGTLAQLLGSTVTFSGKTILTGWNWNATTHKIEISTATISAANGVITSWTDQPVQTVSTTPISSILPSQSGS